MKTLFIPLSIIFLLLITGCGNAASTKATPMFKGKLGTELAQSIKNGDLKKIQQLIANDADVNAVGSKHRSLLIWALLQDKPKAFELLLDHGADSTIQTAGGSTVVHYAAMIPGHPEFLKMLLKNGAPANIEEAGGRTPLFDALGTTTHQQVNLLLEASADINHKTDFGDTPLHDAAAKDDFQDVLKLLKLGADPSVINKQGVTFQGYLKAEDESIFTDEAKKKRQKIRNYLGKLHIEVKF